MLQTFYDFSSAFFRFARRRGLIAIGFVIVGALLDGFGLMMLVPVLELFSGAEQSSVSRWVGGLLARFGFVSRNDQLLVALAAFLVVLFARTVIGWQRDIQVMALSQGFVDHWRSRIFTAIARAPWPVVMRYHRTDLEHAITADVSRLAIGTDRVLKGGITIAMMVIQISIALLLSPMLTLIVIGFIAGSAVLLYPLIRRARVLGEFVTKKGRGVHEILGQFMAGLKLAKAHDAQEKYSARFEAEIRAMRQASLEFSSGQILARSGFQFAAGVVVCAVIIVGLLWLQTPVSVLVVVLIIMGRITTPFMSLVQSFQSFANMIPAFDALRQSESELLAGSYSMPQKARAVRPSSKPHAARVELRGVSYTHEGQVTGGLNSVSCILEAGQITALVGPSGAGKTTLVDILSGLLIPASGEMLIDDGVVDFSTGSGIWQGGLSYVPQDPFLFDVSLRENLLWPDDLSTSPVTDDEIWQALDLVGAADFIRDTPRQLDARAGERGQAFSGGERQRICLARALIRKPRLLIMDEATNAIDVSLESAVLDRLAQWRGRTTVLIITHRQASVVSADKVLHLVKGCLTQNPSVSGLRL